MTGPGPLPMTSTEARELSAYALAKIWADPTTWPMRGTREHRGEHDLQELAVMAGLAHWLTKWLPVQIHRAALAGVDVDAIAAAAGLAPNRIRQVWFDWANRQLQLRRRSGRYGITDGEFEEAKAALRGRVRCDG